MSNRDRRGFLRSTKSLQAGTELTPRIQGFVPLLVWCALVAFPHALQSAEPSTGVDSVASQLEQRDGLSAIDSVRFKETRLMQRLIETFFYSICRCHWIRGHRDQRVTLTLFATTALLIVGSLQAAEVEITIFHTNDLHQNIEPLPRIAGCVAEYKRQHPNTVFVDAGDWFDRGSSLVRLTRGETLYGAMEKMDFVPGLRLTNPQLLPQTTRESLVAEGTTEGLYFYAKYRDPLPDWRPWTKHFEAKLNSK